jgi:hypothetical protein
MARISEAIPTATLLVAIDAYWRAKGRGPIVNELATSLGRTKGRVSDAIAIARHQGRVVGSGRRMRVVEVKRSEAEDLLREIAVRASENDGGGASVILPQEVWVRLSRWGK